MRTDAVVWVFPIILLLHSTYRVTAIHHSSRTSSLCLILPPAIRIKLGQEDALRNECQLLSHGSFAWETNVVEGYEVATKVFQAIADEERSSSRTTLWFPSVKDKHVVESLEGVVGANCNRLGLKAVKSSSWPEVPTIMMELSWSNDCTELCDRGDEFDARIATAVANTQQWVDETLCRLSLCPYTASLQRAAIGLETEGVKEGPVIVRHSSTHSRNARPAATLAAAFWNGVSELAYEPEENVATLLVIGPESYDSDFVNFATVCDELIEPSVQAVGATHIVGRAWFHPKYDAEAIGHSTILPGHALPSSKVNEFVKKYNHDSIPNKELIAHANDAVRWTPHATINLLRRSQLTAAKTAEAAATNSKPNAIYARNVLRIIEDETLLE